MRLEIGTFEVKSARLGSTTHLEKGSLTVNKEELRRLLLEDRSFSDVEIHVATPGESTRITHVLDVVEPRWKVEGPGTVFPGFVGPPVTVGDGKTNRLAGVAVVTTCEPVPGESVQIRNALIDMSGIGSQYGPFGKTINVVLFFKPEAAFFSGAPEQPSRGIGGTPQSQAYSVAMTRAGLKAAAYLGRVTQGMAPESKEVFDLGPCDPALPRVAVVYQAGSEWGATLYGVPTGLMAATLLHPNENFDGALIAGSFRGGTYLEQNNEVLMQLCRLHGKEVNFVGYVVYGDKTPSMEQKDRISSATSKLVRLLGAQAAIFLGQNGSNYAIDCMWALQKCEKAGIKTTLIYNDAGMGADDPGFIFFVPEADAIVSAGTREQPVKLPSAEKVIGGNRLVGPKYEEMDAREGLEVTMRYIHSAINVLGQSHITTRFH